MTAKVITRSSLDLVVPLYNEECRVLETAPALLEFISGFPGGELIWVDDGSTDSTVEVVSRFLGARPGAPARLIERPHRGKGAAVRAGLDIAGADLAGFTDVDLATPLVDFERLVSIAAERRVFVVGSRALPESNVVVHEHPARELLGRLYNRAVQIAATPGIRDTQCGAKVAPRSLWDRVLPLSREEGFAWDVEIIALAQALGAQVCEVPVTWRHDSRSKVHVLKDGLKMGASLLRIRRAAHQAAAVPLAAAHSFEDDGLLVLVDDPPVVQ